MEKLKLRNLRVPREFIITILLSLIFISSAFSLSFEIGSPSVRNALENGRKHLDELTNKAGVPSDGNCWRGALEYLQVGCKVLTEEIQSRMSLGFTSCFLEMLGNPPLMCEASAPVKVCLKGLDNFAKSTFREYFLHTQDMCYYLRQEIWQEATKEVVNRLSDAAEDVTNQMHQQKQIQEQIFGSQQESLKVQQNLKKDNEDLYNAVVKVKAVFDEFSETTQEHQLISSEIFDKLSRMQKLVFWIQGEMSMLDMILWYLAAMIFGYFATTSERTRAARFWLILLFMMTILVEKVVFNYLTNNDRGLELSIEDVHRCISVIRNAGAVIGAFIILISAAVYRNEVSENKMALKNIQFTVDSVAQFLGDLKQICELNEVESRPHILDEMPQLCDDSSDDDSYSNYSSDDSPFELEDWDENKENETRVFNLRARSAIHWENPVLHQESVTEFAKVVRTGAGGRVQNSNTVIGFSSDEN